MTKKDYELIARAIADVKSTQGNSTLLRKVVSSLCIHLRYANPKFDRKRFLEACGVQDA